MMSDQNRSGPQTCDHAHLARLLDEQHALFVRLHALSRRQRVLVEREETEDLLAVLRGREAIVSELGRLSSALEPYREAWDGVLAGAGDEVRERIRDRLDAVADLAKEITESDAADRAALERRRGGLARDLAGVGQHRGAVAAYAGPGVSSAPKFQDREG